MSPPRAAERIDLKTLYLLLTGHQLFSDFPENSINGIYIADQKGNTLWVSSGCEQLWGYAAADLLGKNVVDLERKGVWKPSGVRKVLEARSRVSLTQETAVGRCLRIVGTPVFDGSGSLSRVINGALDVGETGRNAGEGVEESRFFWSESMGEVDRLLDTVAPLDMTVLITGESGTGKEIAARRLHARRSPDGPFVKIDCGAVPANLLESELFGYESGAFSGADKKGKKGLVETAAGGTLFLDEIGEIPLVLQSKFLRLIQDKTYLKLGGTRERTVDTRIIAATHRDLAAMVENKEFRLDLYYRLNVLPVQLPPLRERKDDIPALVDFLRRRFERRFGYVRCFNQQAIACLRDYPWPGNIRELENIVERMMITSARQTIDACDLPAPISGDTRGKPAELRNVMPLRDCLRLTEDSLLRMAWQKYGTTTGVARALGIDQSTASRKLRKLFDPRPDFL